MKFVKWQLKCEFNEANIGPAFEASMTVLTQIEVCLNSRLLIPLSSNTEKLTLSHFLIQRPMKVFLEMIYMARRRQYINIFEMMMSRILTHTITMGKGGPKIKSGPLVPIQDIPPANWELTRVRDDHPRYGGRIRAVTVRSHGTLERIVYSIHDF